VSGVNSEDEGNESDAVSKGQTNKSVRFNDGEEHDPAKDEKPKNTNPLFLQIEALEQELEMLKTKPYENVYEELMLYLEVHDPQKFRRKAKGVQVVPFAMKDFYYRIAKDE